MAERPKDTRLVKGFNYGVDKRMPLGLIDQVVDKKTGLLVGFVKNGQFYNLGDKVKDEPKAPKVDKPKDLKRSITFAEQLLSIKEQAILNYEPGTETYNKIVAGIKKDKDSIKELEERLGTADKAEADKKEVSTYKAEKDTWDSQVADAKRKVAIAKDTDGNVNAAQVQLDKILRSEPKAPVVRTSAPKSGAIPPATKGNFSTDKDGAFLKDGKKYTGQYVVVAEGKTEVYELTNGYVVDGGTYLVYNKDGSSKTFSIGTNKEVKDSATETNTKTSTKTNTKTDVKPTPDKGSNLPKGGKSGDTPPPAPKETAADREAKGLGVAAETDFALPETLFKNIPSLNAILQKYVNTPGMTPDAFRKALRDDVWYKQNSEEIKERFVQYYNFRDLQASGRAQGSTDYEMQIDRIEASLKKRAAVIGSAAASDPAALRKAAENLYITNRSEDESFIDDFLAASIRPVGGTVGGRGTEGFSGQALANYKELERAARDNGLRVSDVIPGGSNAQQVLQGIASGTLDINRIIQDTRTLAAQGQPQYVRDLLSQGYNLNQVFAPYRQTMAAVLEIDDPNAIDLNDPLLRSAISDKGDMNVYDFKKALRKDNRWQYTEQARQDVSSATLDILRDFGFQG